jgi:hypothetical protein
LVVAEKYPSPWRSSAGCGFQRRIPMKGNSSSIDIANVGYKPYGLEWSVCFDRPSGLRLMSGGEKT